jgi:excisionase family DNA binding protein
MARPDNAPISTPSHPPAPRLLYDRKTAATLLSISVRSLDYLIAEGSIRVRRLGGRVLITRKELERFADHDRSEPLVA